MEWAISLIATDLHAHSPISTEHGPIGFGAIGRVHRVDRNSDYSSEQPYVLYVTLIGRLLGSIGFWDQTCSAKLSVKVLA